MATISIAGESLLTDNICQGDVFENVRYTYINNIKNDGVEIIEYTFPFAVIVSQACDVISMGDIDINKAGKSTKFMPSILMCPIYKQSDAKYFSHLEDVFKELEIKKMDVKSDTLFNSGEMNIVNRDWHYRFHSLSVKVYKLAEKQSKKIGLIENLSIDNAIIDFKHYFTVPSSYLIKNRGQRLFRLDDIFAEQITLKFATYLARVAIPD